jgi:hypothetical protein
MQFVEMRWRDWDVRVDGIPSQGCVHVSGSLYKILQYRERQNVNEIGLYLPIWGEWADIN